ncbi:flagellar biosynthetic protein FliO [Cellulomonas sp. P24]|uniref:FliO/MopB family protein n=1 Tax=Cellulomonas sp. P24 TaxID=2885206 RepID=UPI00216B54C8|nr:flagellar biosynthetic protein FliO [Cellulomonas sp. P24]MCR6493464.1 flagellar biosynthetic protein FliO [Cellulomonas sp. P24]
MSTLVLAGRVVLSLACVLGLIWYAQRRLTGPLGRRRPVGPQLSVVGRHTLGRHASVAVLAAGDRRLLIGVTEHGITLLTELDRVEETEAEASDEAVGSTLPARTPGSIATRGVAAVRAVPASTASARVPSANAPAPSAYAVASTAATAAALAASAPAPTSAAARLLARLPVQREEIDVSTLLTGGVDDVPMAVGQTGGLLDGSILAPSTWRRAARAVRR